MLRISYLDNLIDDLMRFFLTLVSLSVLSGFALPHNHLYHYILFHCEITKNDENLNEPILERRVITLIGQMEIFLKTRFYSCPDLLESGFYIIFRGFF